MTPKQLDHGRRGECGQRAGVGGGGVSLRARDGERACAGDSPGHKKKSVHTWKPVCEGVRVCAWMCVNSTLGMESRDREVRSKDTEPSGLA